jgi:hypothetical protein
VRGGAAIDSDCRVAFGGIGVVVVAGPWSAMICPPRLTLPDVNGREFNRDKVAIKARDRVGFPSAPSGATQAAMSVAV